MKKLRLIFFTTQATEIDKREILEKQFTQCARRQADTREYLDHVLGQNCWAYRISVKACSSKGSLEQSEFSKLFTEFMRLAKRAKPCYWLRGYIGIWQEKKTQEIPEFTLDESLAARFISGQRIPMGQILTHDLYRIYNQAGEFLGTAYPYMPHVLGAKRMRAFRG